LACVFRQGSGWYQLKVPLSTEMDS